MRTYRPLVSSVLGAAAFLTVQVAAAQTVKSDHTTVDVKSIPAENIATAQALKMSLSHASVGGNIWDGLNTLASDPTYAFPNWKDNDRGNPGWLEKITGFEAWVAAHANEFDVFQNKFCYIDPDADFGRYRDSMNSLASTYPTKTFVWWTIPITTDGNDNVKRQAFNRQVRTYCAANNRPLFDIADIESHKADGSAVTNSGAEALDPDQSSDGGHLSNLGEARMAQAQWALMAQIAGWRATGASGTPATTGTPTSTGTASDSASQTAATNKSAANPTDNGSGCCLKQSRSASNGSGGLLLGLGLALGLFQSRRRGQS